MTTEVTTTIAQPAAESPEPSSPVQATQDDVTSTPEENPAPKEDPNFSKRFAVLSRQEKLLKQREQELKAQAERYKKYESMEQEDSALRESLKDNPLALLEKYGVSLDDIIQYSLGVESTPEPEDEVTALKKRLDAMEQERIQAEENAKKLAEEEAQKSIDEAVASHKALIADHVKTHADQFELINAKGEDALALVWEVTEAYFEQNQEILDPQAAAQHVESYLEEETKKLLGLSKFKDLGAQPVEPKVEDTPIRVNQSQSNPVPKTITQSYASARPVTQTHHNSNLSPEESKRRAAQFLQEMWDKEKTN